ncbi:hypothetical protein A5M97_13275 [Streptococcus pneumoniae]|nr:hypothetical protein A5M97_13275 [Streptococcus pneumoniae]
MGELTVDARGDIRVQLVWAIQVGRPQIVAVCSSVEIAERYRPFVAEHHRGAMFGVEEVLIDHLFGANDLQSVVYRAALKAEGRDDG